MVFVVGFFRTFWRWRSRFLIFVCVGMLYSRIWLGRCPKIIGIYVSFWRFWLFFRRECGFNAKSRYICSRSLRFSWGFTTSKCGKIRCYLGGWNRDAPSSLRVRAVASCGSTFGWLSIAFRECFWKRREEELTRSFKIIIFIRLGDDDTQ